MFPFLRGDVDDTQKYTDPCDSHTIFALVSYKFSFVIGALSQLVFSALDERSLLNFCFFYYFY